MRILLIDNQTGGIVGDSHHWKGGRFGKTAAKLQMPASNPDDIDDFAKAFACAVDHSNGVVFAQYGNVVSERIQKGYDYHFSYDDTPGVWTRGGSFGYCE